MTSHSDDRPDLTKVALHYGNMRFAMFTVFTAVIGALLAFPFSKGGREFLNEYPTLLKPYGVCALILSALFILAELRISQLVLFYQNRAFNEADFPKPTWHGLWSLIVMVTMIAPYVMSAFFWLVFILSDLSIRASG